MNYRNRKQRPLQIVSRDTPVAEVLRTMQEKNVSMVIVVENAVLIGTVTDRDIAMKALLAGKPPAEITAYDVMTLQPDGCIGKAMRQSELHIME